MSGHDQKMLTSPKSRYKVAANDINRPSWIVLTSLFIPLLFVIILSCYILTMPLDTPSNSTARNMQIRDVRTGVIPVQTLTVTRYGSVQVGTYYIYIPFVVR